jgi:hypothetical protein
MKLNKILEQLRGGEIQFEYPVRDMGPIKPIIQKIEDICHAKLKATVSQDTPFIYEITLPTNSSIRFSGFRKLTTITNSSFTDKVKVDSIINALKSHGFCYVDELEMGPPLRERLDLMEDNLFNRLFGYLI